MITEPGPFSFSLLGAFVYWLGPVLGPYALIVFAAVVGSMLLLSARTPDATSPRWYGVKFIALGAVIALLLTGPLAWGVHAVTGIPANVALIPLAFMLGLARDKLVALINRLLDAIASRAAAVLSSEASPKGGAE